MKLKSYFSGTVEAAMKLARKELGEDALLVNARPAMPETQYLGAYEVVFGLADGATAPLPSRTASGNRLAEEVAELKREFERMALTLRNSSSNGEISVPAPLLVEELPLDANHLYSRLVAQDLDSTLAQSVARGTPLQNFVKTDSTLGVAGSSRRVIVLVGPPGAGKTTTLVKLAARYGLQKRASAQILTADVYTIAAADQLCSLASILGIACEVAETATDLEQKLQEYHSRALVLIDMPGLTRAEMGDAAELIQFVQSQPDFDVHLVLPAYLRPADMSTAIELYSCFAPKKLLFTRIDETAQYGTMVGESARSSLPISFFANGQQIPDDLEAATPEKLAELILGTEPQQHEPARLAKGAAA